MRGRLFLVSFLTVVLFFACLVYADVEDGGDDPAGGNRDGDTGDGGNGGDNGSGDCSLLVLVNHHLMLYSGGQWRDVSSLFGHDPAQGQMNIRVSHLQGGYFLAGNEGAAWHLVQPLSGKRTPAGLPLIRTRSFVHGLLRGADGTLWWKHLFFTYTELWSTSAGVNRKACGQHGWGQYDMLPAGEALWVVNRAMGGNESGDFPDMFPGNPDTLYFAPKAGGPSRVVLRASYIRSPRFVDRDKIVYWADGPVNPAANTKTWILRTVTIAGGAVNEVMRLTIPRMSRQEPPLVVGQGVIGWADDWTRDDEQACRWSFLVNGTKRSVDFSGWRPVMPIRRTYSDGRVVFYNRSRQQYAIYNAMTGTRHEIAAGTATGVFLDWAETLPAR